jgi:hypothetical protein
MGTKFCGIVEAVICPCGIRTPLPHVWRFSFVASRSPARRNVMEPHSDSVQSGARRDGIAGIYGNLGIVESLTYRF